MPSPHSEVRSKVKSDNKSENKSKISSESSCAKSGKVLPLDSWQSLSLLRFHGDMLKALARIGLSGVVKGQQPSSNPEQFDDIHISLPAPNADLVASYNEWSHKGITPIEKPAPAQLSYTPERTLPVHFFSQFAIAVCVKQLRLTRYPLHRIINQGTGFTQHAPIPLGERLKVVCKMRPITEKNNRARVHQVLQIGTITQPNCWEVDFHTLFILGKSDGKNRSDNGTDQAPPQWQEVGQWQVAPQDGWQFALLTGDFNPIHWVDWLAKKSPFGQKVLHGFGMFARTIATLEAAKAQSIKRTQVRFTGPARLNGQSVSVFITEEAFDENNQHRLELRDHAGAVLMAGSVGF